MPWLDEGFDPTWLSESFQGNSVRDWLIAIAVAAGTYVAVAAVRRVVTGQLERTARMEASRFIRVLARALHHTRWFFYLALSVFFGSKMLLLAEWEAAALRAVTVTAVLVQVGVWGQAAVRHAVALYQGRHEKEPGSAATMAAALGFLGRMAVWGFVALLILANLGIEISALIAGLGVGGIAAALAVQNVASDLIASISIYFDRPFDIGDFIKVGDQLGTVERVGMRSTRLESLWGEQITIANGDMTKSRIHNLSRIEKRRIHFTIGVVYETPHEKLMRIPEIVREAIEADDSLEFLRSHFKGYGDYALLFETAYHVLDPSYDVYMERQHTMNLTIFERFEREGIRFAYPTQTLHVQRIEPA